MDPRQAEVTATLKVSILFRPGEQPETTATAEVPAFVQDLHLGAIADAVAAASGQTGLRDLFLTSLRSPDAVHYRVEVFRDLDDPDLLAAVRLFADHIDKARLDAAHAQRVVYPNERNRWLAEAANMFCDAVAGLGVALDRAPLRSRALVSLRSALHGYAASDEFLNLAADTASVLRQLAGLTYRLDIDVNLLTVSKGAGEPDYGAEILATFDPFRQPGSAPLHVDVFRSVDMNPVEVGILQRVSRLYPAAFQALDAFAAEHRDFLDAGIAAVADELAFYLAYLAVIAPLRSVGLPFSYADVADRSTGTSATGGGFVATALFDLALALKRASGGGAVVTNDVSLVEPERLLVITGANQGGKTTLARAIGQLHHLAAIGVPVPARSARVWLVDAVHTHFDRPEELGDMTGRLEADLRRAKDLVDLVTADSLVILNEAFSSTTLEDALALNRAVLSRIAQAGAQCVTVTFLGELAAGDPATVSVADVADPDNPARRTFRFARRAADGLALAQTIADLHRLDYASVRDRVGR